MYLMECVHLQGKQLSEVSFIFTAVSMGVNSNVDEFAPLGEIISSESRPYFGRASSYREGSMKSCKMVGTSSLQTLSSHPCKYIRN